MFDLQVVYIRNLVELTAIDLAVMLKVVNVDPANFAGVTADNAPAPYMLVGDELLVGLPEGRSFLDIGTIRVLRKVTDGDGSTFTVGEVINVVSGTSASDGTEFAETFKSSGIRQPTAEGTFRETGQVVGYLNILKVSAHDLSKLVEIRVNGRSMPFTLSNTTTALVQFPENAATIESVDAIVSSSTLNRKTFFSYLLTDNPKQVSGPFKALSQFLKILMTTPGTDIFNKDIGGNLQNWVGGRNPLNNPQALITKTVLTIVSTGAKFSALQLLSGVPPDERVSRIQVLGISFDSEDPTKMSISLKLVMASQENILFGLGLDSIDSVVASVSSTLTG